MIIAMELFFLCICSWVFQAISHTVWSVLCWRMTAFFVRFFSHVAVSWASECKKFCRWFPIWQDMNWCDFPGIADSSYNFGGWGYCSALTWRDAFPCSASGLYWWNQLSSLVMMLNRKSSPPVACHWSTFLVFQDIIISSVTWFSMSSWAVVPKLVPFGCFDDCINFLLIMFSCSDSWPVT